MLKACFAIAVAVGASVLCVAAGSMPSAFAFETVFECPRSLVSNTFSCSAITTVPGGETQTVSCKFDADEPERWCPSMVCHTVIADDAPPAYPEGVSWNEETRGYPVGTHDTERYDDAIRWLAAGGPDQTWNSPGNYNPPPEYATLPGGLFSETGRWFECSTTQLSCGGVLGNTECDVAAAEPETETVWGPEGPPIDVQTLLDQATAQLVIPDPPITTAPPLSSHMFVQMPAWFWVEEAYWNEDRIAEQPSAGGGRLTVRVIGEPQYTQVDPGDGADPISCTGPGKEFRLHLDPWTGSDCHHVYHHTPNFTGEDTFPVETLVAFVLRWEMDFNGQIQDRGTMGTVYRSTTHDVEVTEIQALVLE